MKRLRARQTGVSLIELMIALAVAGIVVAGVYETFMVEQKGFVVQQEVSEAQQSARAIMDMIGRDIRMAGFGIPDWPVSGLANAVQINQTSPADFTLVGAFSGPIGKLSANAAIGQNQISVNTLGQDVELAQGENLLIFESDRPVPPILDAPDVLAPPLRYTTVVVWTTTSGSDPVVDIDADGMTTGTRESLDVSLRSNALVYRVGTVTYQLVGNNLMRNGSILATDVTGFEVTDRFDPGPPPVPETFGSYRIVLTVASRTADPDFPGGRRTRTLTSTIKARNIVYES